MAASSRQRSLVRALVETHGTTFADELGIRIEENSPAPLFQLLCAALLYSARISAANATRAMKALLDAGMTTPAKMAAASWQERVDVITWHGYKRYDESTSTMLGDTAERLIETYDGDLRQLRNEAGREVSRERELLKQFKGIGDVGADIFLREVQVVWEEAYPYVDGKVRKAARKLGLPGDPDELAKLASQSEFARLVAALVRTDLEDAYEDVRRRAS